jgi:hypothetical protein
MKAVVFVGPSLPEAQVKEILPEALVMPPAEQGDIDFARYQLGADVIGLIDGVHTMRLPPLHKEILSVLNDGCRFIGAASMGALRAVECEDYGAEPVGEVARMYKEGEIEDDSEVCLVHGDRDDHYKHLSIPLVEIRATMKAADIDEELKKEIIDYAKSLYYPDREWQNIFDACDVDNRQAMLIDGSQVDIKGADSLHLCYKIAKGHKTSTAKRTIRNAHYGFAQAFEQNDRKILHGGKVIRKYQVAERASRYDSMNARNRALALELCKILGIQQDASIDWEYPDLSQEESMVLGNEELSLSQAGDWIASRASSLDMVKLTNDFLRISGRYESIKESI